MNANETNNNEFSLTEHTGIGGAELESIAAGLPLRSGLQAGLQPCI